MCKGPCYHWKIHDKHTMYKIQPPMEIPALNFCCMTPLANRYHRCVHQVAAPFSMEVRELWSLLVAIITDTSAVCRLHKPANDITPGRSLQSLQWHSSSSPLVAHSYDTEASPTD